MREHILWWMTYLRVFAMNTPWGKSVKFTIWVDEWDGERTAEIWKTTPVDVVDGYGRPCKMIQTRDKSMIIQWPIRERTNQGGPTSTWGGGHPPYDPNDRYKRNPETGALELRNPWPTGENDP
jgi:hypothetical protein